jgi:hypothetical protein
MGVDARHPLYDKYIDTWIKCADAYEGQEAIKAKQSKYLPRLSGHMVEHEKQITADERSRGWMNSDTEYQLYLQRAVFYNYTKKITNGLNEQLFRKDVKLETPAVMQSIVDNFTYDGKSIKTAIKESNKRILLKYRDVLVLDFPKSTTEGPISQAQAESMNLRPYAVYYTADQVINWNYEIINNKLELTRVVIEEHIEEQDPDDEFIMKDVLQYRVLDLSTQDENGFDTGVRKYRIRLFKKSEKEEEIDTIFPKIKGEYLTYIPCFFLTPKGISDDLDYPMMNDAVDINIAHYINSADYENAINITGSPTPVIVGYNTEPDSDEDIALGSRALLLYGQNAQAYYMEYKGQGPDAIAKAMDKKVDALSVIASRMLQNDPKGIESAETAEIHRSAEQGMLSSMALSLSEAYEVILNIIADWMNVTGNITVMFNTDYSIKNIDPNLFSNLTTARQAGAISQYLYFYNLLKGEMVPEDWTYEQENEARAEDAVAQATLTVGFDEEEEEQTEETEEEETEE